MSMAEERAWNMVISRKITWSQLARLGTAPIMRLTTLIPLIGIFLLFNEQTKLIFEFPQFFKIDIGEDEESNISSSNLYFTYFGLCSLGIASMLFALFCPREVQDQPNRQQFVLQATSLETPVLAKAHFNEVLELHHTQISENSSSDNPNYPEELKADFHALMEEFYNKSDLDHEEIDPDMLEVMTTTGYLDFTEFAHMLWTNPRVVWPITLPVFAEAPKLAKDVASVRHQALNFTKYRTRFSIMVLYIFGFALLVFPTIRVFVLLSYGLIFGWPQT